MAPLIDTLASKSKKWDVEEVVISNGRPHPDIKFIITEKKVRMSCFCGKAPALYARTKRKTLDWQEVKEHFQKPGHPRAMEQGTVLAVPLFLESLETKVEVPVSHVQPPPQ